MYRIHKTAQAEQDLYDIWLYSAQTWGVHQADTYLDALEVALIGLQANPQLGRSREALRPGYRSLAAERHTIFYRVAGQVVQVVRILHSGMDPDRHL